MRQQLNLHYVLLALKNTPTYTYGIEKKKKKKKKKKSSILNPGNPLPRSFNDPKYRPGITSSDLIFQIPSRVYWSTWKFYQDLAEGIFSPFDAKMHNFQRFPFQLITLNNLRVSIQKKLQNTFFMHFKSWPPDSTPESWWTFADPGVPRIRSSVLIVGPNLPKVCRSNLKVHLDFSDIFRNFDGRMHNYQFYFFLIVHTK